MMKMMTDINCHCARADGPKLKLDRFNGSVCLTVHVLYVYVYTTLCSHVSMADNMQCFVMRAWGGIQPLPLMGCRRKGTKAH